MYLDNILQKYSARNSNNEDIVNLKSILREWAHECYIDILDSGSRAKNTAISISSDFDYVVSLTSNCNENSGGLKAIYDSLFSKLSGIYTNVFKQNVSVRIELDTGKTIITSNKVSIDITPARKYSGNTNYHSLYVSKTGTWKVTNIQRHISDVSNSGRTNEIKLLKIWRELNKIDFPSIYLEYLVINNILLNRSKASHNMGDNFWHALRELAKDVGNPLFARITDPSNTNNILSESLTNAEKNLIIKQAKNSINHNDWRQIVW